jgi:hypothetical protein
MELQVSPNGQELAGKFKEAARRGDYSEAFSCLQGLSLLDALVSCLELAATDGPSFSSLSQQATGKERGQFSVRLVKDGFIPGDRFGGIGDDDDYHVARIFILRIREAKRTLAASLWPDVLTTAQSKPFYPDAIAASPGRRERICSIAQSHAARGPGDEHQIALFSLGGRYDYATAKAGTRPGKGTTCILFARDVLHAAGCNVISPTTSSISNVPLGLLAELPKASFGYVAAADYDQGARPQRGDIFHIQGDNYRDKDGNDSGVDSTHVGIIVDTAGDREWITVEGGALDHVTRRTTRKLVEAQSRHGKWAFEGDNTSAGVRPLRGWYDIGQIKAGQWMV